MKGLLLRLRRYMANQLFGKSMLNVFVSLLRNDLFEAVISFLEADSLISESTRGSVVSWLLLFQVST